jgi:hypothetical protein
MISTDKFFTLPYEIISSLKSAPYTLLKKLTSQFSVFTRLSSELL